MHSRLVFLRLCVSTSCATESDRYSKGSNIVKFCCAHNNIEFPCCNSWFINLSQVFFIKTQFNTFSAIFCTAVDWYLLPNLCASHLHFTAIFNNIPLNFLLYHHHAIDFLSLASIASLLFRVLRRENGCNKPNYLSAWCVMTERLWCSCVLNHLI